MPNQVNVNGVLRDLNVVRLVGGYLGDMDGNLLDGIPVYTMAGRPDAASVSVGSLIRHPRSEFTFVGGAALTAMPARGIILESNGVTWHTPNKQLYAQEFSTKASPLVSIPTGTEAVEANVVLPNGNILFPANFTHLGFKVSIEGYWGKGATSGAGSNFYTKLGVSSTVLSNPIVSDITVSTGTNKQQMTNTFIQFLSASSMTWTDTQPNSTAGVATSGALGGFMDASITHNYGSTYKVSFSLMPGTGGGTNTDLFFGYRIFLEV